MALTLVLLGGLAAEGIRLALSYSENDRSVTISYIVRVAFGFYLLLLAVFSIGQRSTGHWRLVVHISCLTAAAFLLFAISATLPSRVVRTSTHLQYAPVAAYFLACAVAITIPRGPPLHYPSEHIYSDKTLMAVTSKYEDNVCESVNASVLDSLLFSYTTKVVTLGHTTESFEIGDLPIVPANMRAVYLFASMRSAIDEWSLQLFSWRPKSGSGWELAYRIVRVNAGTLATLVALAAAAASLFYAPSFFLQRIVRYVEGDPERTGWQWGLLFSAGLFLSNAAWQIGKTDCEIG